jgi:GNAT superfamily N-acetyltransferase
MWHQSNYNFLAQIKLEPLSVDNWDKLEDLFGSKGACGNCWCMSFRLNKKEFEAGKVNEGNKISMKSLVWSNKPTGVLALYEDKAIAWLALAPREDFIRLKKSRIHKPIDDLEVWSIPCTFISKPYRRKGLSVALLNGVIEYARSKHIIALEAYPTLPTTDKLPEAFLWVGLFKSFERAGFKIVDRTSKNRPMVRYLLNN